MVIIWIIIANGAEQLSPYPYQGPERQEVYLTVIC